ncbi:hypothetical protein ACH675_01070, partial [Klebsiella pneumoniae]
KKSAQIREILISESAWEEMTCLFAPSQRLNGFGFDRRKRHLAGRGGFGCCQRQRLGVTILNQSCIKKQQAAMW